MSYFFIALFLIFILIVSYKIFINDILSPTFITALSFFICLIFSIIGLASWNYDKNLDYRTILILFFGIGSFFIGEIFIRKVFQNKRKDIKKSDTNKKIEITYISRKTIILLLIFVLITTILLVKEIKKVCIAYGLSGQENFSDMIAFYRTKSILFSSQGYTSNIQVNSLVKQMQKVSNAINIILAVYFIDYLMKSKFEKKEINIINSILIILTILIALLQTILYNGGRSILFHYLLAYGAIFIFDYLYVYNYRITFKTIKYIIGFGVILIVIFNFALKLVGRETKHNPIVYTSFSIGTSIPSLDLYIKRDNSHTKKIGEETFPGIYYTLNKIKIIEYSKPQTHEWYAFAKDGTLSSNVFTSLRSYYKDFGFIGVLILQLFFGIMITMLYLNIKDNKNQLFKIIYFYYFYILVDQIRDEQFYSLINISNVAYIIIITCLFELLRILGNRKEENEYNKKI